MSRPAQIVSLVAVLFAALALGACGGASDSQIRNAYVQRVNAAQTEFAATVTTVSKRITRQSSSADDRRTLQQFQVAIQTAVRKLREVTVPDNVTTEHSQLVRAMSGFGTQIKKATDALRNPDSRAIAGAQRTIQSATQTVNARIESAIAAINSKLGAK